MSSQLYLGDCNSFLDTITDPVQLIVTSPPYNLDKEYEDKMPFEEYFNNQALIIEKCAAILDEKGSICWQVGNNIVDTGRKKELFPLDILLYPLFKQVGLTLKNRIVWHYGHGLHDTYRFSGRHETILWFVKSENYVFNLDPIRVPQKYPSKKYFKGPRKGQLSGNPLGKNPGDVWDIPNVKHNHPEKTAHPCQFPLKLVERLILSLSNEGNMVFDPYIGSGTTAVAALKHGRNVMGCDISQEYLDIAQHRIEELNGTFTL